MRQVGSSGGSGGGKRGLSRGDSVNSGTSFVREHLSEMEKTKSSQSDISSDVANTEASILKLLSSLDQSIVSGKESSMIHAQNLLDSLEKSQVGVQSELMILLDNFQNGFVTADHLAAMLENERLRGEYIQTESFSMTKHLGALFTRIREYTERLREETGNDEDDSEQNNISSGMDEFMREMQNLSKVAKTSVREVKSVVGNVQSKNKLKEVGFQNLQSVAEISSTHKGLPKKKVEAVALPVKPNTEHKGTNTLFAGSIDRDIQTEISRKHMIHLDEKLGNEWWGAGGGALEGGVIARVLDQTQLRLNSPTATTHLDDKELSRINATAAQLSPPGSRGAIGSKGGKRKAKPTHVKKEEAGSGTVSPNTNKGNITPTTTVRKEKIADPMDFDPNMNEHLPPEKLKSLMKSQKRDSTTTELKELLMTTNILGIVQEGETVSIEFEKQPVKGGASTDFFHISPPSSTDDFSRAHSPTNDFLTVTRSSQMASSSFQDLPAQLEEVKMSEAFLRRSVKNRDDEIAVIKAQMAAQEELHEKLVREATTTITDLTTLCSETQNKLQTVEASLQATKAEVLSLETTHTTQVQTLQKTIQGIRNRPLLMRQQSGMIVALDVEPQNKKIEKAKSNTMIRETSITHASTASDLLSDSPDTTKGGKKSKPVIKSTQEKKIKKVKMLSMGTQTEKTSEEMRNMVVRQIKGLTDEGHNVVIQRSIVKGPLVSLVGSPSRHISPVRGDGSVGGGDNGDYPPERDPLHVTGVSFATLSPERPQVSPLQLLMDTFSKAPIGFLSAPVTHSAPHSPLPPLSAAGGADLLSPIAALNSTQSYDVLTQGTTRGHSQGPGIVSGPSARGQGPGLVSARGPGLASARGHAPSAHMSASTLNHSQRRSSLSPSLFSVSNRPFDPFSRVLPIFSISFTATKISRPIKRSHSYNALGQALGLVGGVKDKLPYEQQVMNGLMDDSRITTAGGNTPSLSTALPDLSGFVGDNNEENDPNTSSNSHTSNQVDGPTSTTTSRAASLHLQPPISRPTSRQHLRPSSIPAFVPELMVVPTVITNLTLSFTDHHHNAHGQGLVSFYGMGGGMGVGHGPHDHHSHTHKHGHKGQTKEDKEEKRALNLSPALALTQLTTAASRTDSTDVEYLLPAAKVAGNAVKSSPEGFEAIWSLTEQGVLPLAASPELVSIVADIATNAMTTNTTNTNNATGVSSGFTSAATSQKDKTSNPAAAPWINYLPRTFVTSTFEQSANAVRLLADAARSPHAYFPPAISYLANQAAFNTSREGGFMAILGLAQLAVTPQPASPAAVDLSVMAAVRAIEEWHHIPQDERERSVTEQQDLLHPHNTRRSQKNDGNLRRSTKAHGGGGGKSAHTSSQKQGEGPVVAVAGGNGVGGGVTPRGGTGVQAMMDRYGHTLHDNQGPRNPDTLEQAPRSKTPSFMPLEDTVPEEQEVEELLTLKDIPFLPPHLPLWEIMNRTNRNNYDLPVASGGGYNYGWTGGASTDNTHPTPTNPSPDKKPMALPPNVIPFADKTHVKTHIHSNHPSPSPFSQPFSPTPFSPTPFSPGASQSLSAVSSPAGTSNQLVVVRPDSAQLFLASPPRTAPLSPAVEQTINPPSITIHSMGHEVRPRAMNSKHPHKDGDKAWTVITRDQGTSMYSIDDELDASEKEQKSGLASDTAQDQGLGLLVQGKTMTKVVTTLGNISMMLKQSDNPLFTLYQEYAHLIPPVSRARFLRAAATATEPGLGSGLGPVQGPAQGPGLGPGGKSEEVTLFPPNILDNMKKSQQQGQELVNGVFGAYALSLTDVEKGCIQALQDLIICERMAKNLALLTDATGAGSATGGTKSTSSVYNQSVHMMLTKFGEVEIFKLWAELQLVELRAALMEIKRRQVALSSNHMLMESEEYKMSIKLLADTQGHVVDIKRRLSILRERCARLDLSYQATSEHQHLLSGIYNHLATPVPRVEGVDGVVSVGMGGLSSQTDRSEHTTSSALSMPSLVHHTNQHAPIAMQHHHHHNNQHDAQHDHPYHDHGPSSSITETTSVKTRASILEQHLASTPFVSHHATPHHSGIQHKASNQVNYIKTYLIDSNAEETYEVELKKLKEEVALAQAREAKERRGSVLDWDGSAQDETLVTDVTDTPPVEDTSIQAHISRAIASVKESEKEGGKGNPGGGNPTEGTPGPGLAQGPGLNVVEEGDKLSELVNSKRPSTRMTDDLVENDSDLMNHEMNQIAIQNTHENGESRSVEHTTYDEDEPTFESSSRSRYYNQMLVAEIQRLKKELRDMNDDIEQLTLEKFKIATEKDCTPAAMLFFSTLHDPNMVPTIQQLIIQLNGLKGVADCSTHMDFSTLRKRLLVCTSATQILDNFVVRYNSMYKRWVYNRFAMFTSPQNKQDWSASGLPDSAVCPLCSNDLSGSAADIAGAKMVLSDEAILRDHYLASQSTLSPHQKHLAFGRATGPSASPLKRPSKNAAVAAAKLEPLVYSLNIPAAPLPMPLGYHSPNRHHFLTRYQQQQQKQQLQPSPLPSESFSSVPSQPQSLSPPPSLPYANRHVVVPSAAHQSLLPLDYSVPPSPQIRPVHKPLAPSEGIIAVSDNPRTLSQSQSPLLASEYKGPKR